MRIRAAQNIKKEETEIKSEFKLQEIVAEKRKHREIITTTEIQKAVTWLKKKCGRQGKLESEMDKRNSTRNGIKFSDHVQRNRRNHIQQNRRRE